VIDPVTRWENCVRLVIALGGNAMTAADGAARPEDQREAIERAAEPIAELIGLGHQVVLTHGNGPQVGNLLVKNELAAAVVPPVPLDWCGAQTQGTIGTLILNALDRAMAHRGSGTRAAVLVSRTRVVAGDEGFSRPSKPIGRYLPASEARVMIGHGQHWEDRGERGWRRIVASPEPIECVDSPAAVALLEAGFVVVCSGGGGIPVIDDGDGGLQGVEAVIDKDLTAALLAESLQADRLIIATDVENAVVGWDTPQARPLAKVSLVEIERLAAAGEFASGSMGPKIEAARRFAAATGRPAVITSLSRIADALSEQYGTIISPNTEGDPGA
jgi:carbamate kinase